MEEGRREDEGGGTSVREGSGNGRTELNFVFAFRFAFGPEQWRKIHLGRLLKEQEKGLGGVEEMEVDEEDLYS